MIFDLNADYLCDFDLNADDDQVVDGGSPQQLPTELNRQLRLHRVQKLGVAGGGETVESGQLGGGVGVGRQAGRVGRQAAGVGRQAGRGRGGGQAAVLGRVAAARQLTDAAGEAAHKIRCKRSNLGDQKFETFAIETFETLAIKTFETLSIESFDSKHRVHRVFQNISELNLFCILGDQLITRGFIWGQAESNLFKMSKQRKNYRNFALQKWSDKEKVRIA